jgi:hypothetical protein
LRFSGGKKPYDIDIMPEIKEKDYSVIKAVELTRRDECFFRYIKSRGQIRI